MTNVREAVAKREAAPAKVPVATIVRQAIEQQSGRFQAVVPAGFDAGRFANLVLTSIKSKPELIRCFETEAGKISVLLAAMQAATIGLEPDTPLEEAWLLPRKNQGRQECQLSIGYRGMIKLARQSGVVKSVAAQVVYEGDEFAWSYGLESDTLDHVPCPRDQRGELTYAYAIARYTDGGYNFVVLDRADVEARRARSDGWKNERSRPFSPWTTNEAAMWRKSAVRELFKWMPKSAAVAAAVNADERVLTFDDDGTIMPAQVIEHEDAIDVGEITHEGTPDDVEALPLDAA